MKNFKTFAHILALTLSFSLFFSCKHGHEHDEVIPEAISVTINAPIAAQEYEAGDTVFMKAKITSPTLLHGYKILLKRLADATAVFSKDIDAHTNGFDINEIWVNDGKVHSDMELEISAIINQAGNKSTKKVNFHCHEL